MAYATQKHLCPEVPELEPGENCRSLLTLGAVRPGVTEGGLRKRGQYKRSLPNLPLVTVVTVVRNFVSTIEQCLLSVLDQGYENIEYVIVDGASTDGTLEIIERYGDALDYFVSEPDSGIYNAMNKGLQLALGDYLLLLNADDWYREDAVELLVTEAVKSQADVTHADAWATDDSGRRIRVLPGWLNDGIFTRGMPLRHETMLVARHAYSAYGNYDESYEIIADWVWTTNAYSAGCSFCHVDQPILNFRSHGVSNTDKAKRTKERMRFLSELFPFLDLDELQLIAERSAYGLRKKLKLLNKYKRQSKKFTRSLALHIIDSLRKRRRFFFRKLLARRRKL